MDLCIGLRFFSLVLDLFVCIRFICRSIVFFFWRSRLSTCLAGESMSAVAFDIGVVRMVDVVVDDMTAIAAVAVVAHRRWA